MSKFWNFTQSRLLPLLLLAGASGSSLVLAQGDLETGMKSKELVDEMKKQEIELRAETQKKIARKRERAIEDLEKLRRLYKSLSKKSEENSIEEEIKILKKKMTTPEDGKSDTRDRDNKPEREDSENQYFEYRTSYLFDEKGIISGKFIFMPNQKVRIIYKYKGKETSEFWDWKDMGDHVQISAGLPLGKIIISESPKSNLKSLLIRWGGELTNKLTDGHSE